MKNEKKKDSSVYFAKRNQNGRKYRVVGKFISLFSFLMGNKFLDCLTFAAC